ncbi:MAG: fumarylacetoacetase [Saprospiraceae bacterium]|nr:fumarylacetoacetase [Saprospiraceae bacterium]
MNDYSLTSWVEVPPDSDFPIQNLPFGVFRYGQRGPSACSIIGDQIIDLVALHAEGLLPVPGVNRAVLEQPYLNDFIALGKSTANAVRAALTEVLKSEAGTSVRETVTKCLVPVQQAEMCLPVKVGDYTDFYSSKEHATNVGSMFRDPANALLPNWLHLPVGYHGRASSIVVSGTPVKRPYGQTMPEGATSPQYGPSRLLDFELEMGFIIGKPNQLGTQITTAEAEEHIFGLVLFNDWSARDIQKWEYVPLGPFLGKSFASTISPWIVMLEALDPFRVAGPVQTPGVLPYLQYEGKKNYDINLEVAIQTPTGAEVTVCRSNSKYLYWNMCQQLAHHTVNGCNMNVGDLCASGTISGPDPSSYGSMLELTWRGTKPIQMPDGSERKFLNDGDTVVLRGYALRHGVRIGFGEASGQVVA